MNGKLTAERFDGTFVAKPEKLWGAPAIAQALGVSVDTIYRWSNDAAVPIYRPGGATSLSAQRSKFGSEPSAENF